MGITKILTVSTEVNMSPFTHSWTPSTSVMPFLALHSWWPSKKIAKLLHGSKCEYTDDNNLIPKIAITRNAAVSKKGYFSISFTKRWATKRMASMPIKTPTQISIIFLLNATAANTLSIEKAISITSTRATVAQKFPILPTVTL